MGKIGQFVLGGLFILLVVQIIIIAPKSIQESGAPEPVEAGPVDQQIEQAMKGAHMVETQDSSKEWELWAEDATRYRNNTTLTLNKVKALFFGKDGVTFTVTGDKGIVEEKTKNMQVEGNVVTKSSNGYTFKTQSMIYDSKKRKLDSMTPVEMTGPRDAKGPGLFLRGDKMHANLADSSMLVSGNIFAEKVIEKERKVIIKSHEALFSGKSRIAKFMGEVLMDLDTMRVTGPTAEFIYDPKMKTVKSVVVDGGVKVTDLDKWATSERLRVDLDEEKYIFKGRPRVVQNQDELVGEEIIFLDGGRKVKVIGAKARVDQKRMEKR